MDTDTAGVSVLETAECTYCKKPVCASEAYPVHVTRRDGTEAIAIFHGPPEPCGLLWALDRMKGIAVELMKFSETLKKEKSGE
jgi:hypothetical protein